MPNRADKVRKHLFRYETPALVVEGTYEEAGTDRQGVLAATDVRLLFAVADGSELLGSFGYSTISRVEQVGDTLSFWASDNKIVVKGIQDQEMLKHLGGVVRWALDRLAHADPVELLAIQLREEGLNPNEW